jgi:large subunit ribosomal protein L23
VFKVEVVKINIQNVRGKEKRMGRYVGRTAARRKALVTLAAGQRIQQLDGLT